MKKVKLQVLIESALRQMRQDGATIEALKSYKSTVFGAIFRHCQKTGHLDYSETVINKFISQLRSEYEHEKISKSKLEKVCRGAELLKHFYATGTLRLPKEALYNELHRNPTYEELKDDSNIFALVWRTKQKMLEFSLTPDTLLNYKYKGFFPILRNHIENGLTQYSSELTSQLSNTARKNYEAGIIDRGAYQCVRKTTNLLKEFYETGTLIWRYIPKYGLRELSDGFYKLLANFCEDVNKTSKIKHSTSYKNRSFIRRFLFELEDVNIYSFDDVTHKIVSERMTNLAQSYAGGVVTLLSRVRKFLKYLHSNGFTKDDFSFALPELTAPRGIINEGFSDNEIDELFSQIDKTTAIGKRDYAIMMLALKTGLRGCDIANLKLLDIDWHKYEIRISQVKTYRAQSLPLPVESGNAIADYILNCRPECNVANVFLCSNAPLRPLNNDSVGCMVKRYMQKTNIAVSTANRRGIHSFRRTFGKRLLEAETSLDMLNELLGHADMNSSKSYISIDDVGLKKCALGLIYVSEVGVVHE